MANNNSEEADSLTVLPIYYFTQTAHKYGPQERVECLGSHSPNGVASPALLESESHIN